LRNGRGGQLPEYYRRFLRGHPDGVHGDIVFLYGLDDVVERNTTFEVKEYCPGHIAIGDDSGGRCIVTSLADSRGVLFLVDQGDMTPGGFEPLASGFDAWLSEGCPIP
jgi:hypothetical protein